MTDFFFFSLYLIVALQNHCGNQSLNLHNNTKCKPATLAAVAKRRYNFFSHTVIVIALTGGV